MHHLFPELLVTERQAAVPRRWAPTAGERQVYSAGESYAAGWVPHRSANETAELLEMRVTTQPASSQGRRAVLTAVTKRDAVGSCAALANADSDPVHHGEILLPAP